MAETTGISWTRSSWSPWIGCTRVSPGCDHCYAEALDKRHKYGGAVHWGPGVPRYRTKSWGQPIAWNKKAALTGERWTVFPSLCDPFDKEVPDELRLDLFDLIDSTPNLTWLLLTKRIGNVSKMMPAHLFPDGPPPNVWIGASLVNQEEADRDIPKLLATPAAKRFVSYEPALGPINFSPFLRGENATEEQRGYRLPGSPDGRIGDRRTRSDLAPGVPQDGSVERGHEVDPVRTPTRGEQSREVSSDQGDVRRQESARASASAGVATFQRPDPGWLNGQPQGRREEEERTGQPGISDRARTDTACDRRFKAPRIIDAERYPQPSSEIVRGASIGNQAQAIKQRETSCDRKGLLDNGANRFQDSQRGASISWLIVGGESAQGGAKARPFDVAWARSTVVQCEDAGVPVFVKQLGSHAGTLLRANDGTWEKFPTKDRAGADPAEWPADLQVQQVPA